MQVSNLWKIYLQNTSARKNSISIILMIVALTNPVCLCAKGHAKLIATYWAQSKTQLKTWDYLNTSNFIVFCFFVGFKSLTLKFWSQNVLDVYPGHSLIVTIKLFFLCSFIPMHSKYTCFWVLFLFFCFCKFRL